MNDADREEIEHLKSELERAGVDPVSKLRGHRALVLSAKAANGCLPEERTLRMAEAIHALSVLMVGFVAGAPACTEAAARKAVSDCPLRSVHSEVSERNDVASQSWERVAKEAVMRSPMAVAIVIAALILRGFGPVILKALAS